ncbi:MT-A70 family methyltransferase [Bradyrhizobium elkanii]|uniref:MT-A70 family methyltransferase n=1 Tax=Bradyrhizobium elkanii TaxID=29448 RepID=UPI0010200EA9|nr:MT-A70 family methyltransferase [Bradyrhizobium elkanii]NWL40377.1 hypothetical protein [Bradyrhizobium elkanii]RYM21120.1 hypothetical protein EWH13_28315 [Bradyrhizobium elkanii]
MTPLAIHPYANLFPLIEGQEFYEMAEDVRVNGLREQIDLVDVDGVMQILDGRNRYRCLVWIVTKGEPLGEGWEGHAGRILTAADLANHDDIWLYQEINPDYYGGDLLSYVLSKNLNRRHLTDDDRRIVAAKLVSLRQGRPSEKTSHIANISREQAAAVMSTDVAGIDRARSVLAHAVPEIVDAVEHGKVSVAAAAEIAAQPTERQAEIVAALPRDAEGKLTPEVKKALAPVIKEIRREKVQAKRERRDAREQETGRRLQALPEKNFGVAIEDFEWDHATWSRETGTERHPSMHYETAEDAHTPEEIVARCAERFACLADDCVLFKWTTIPHLAIAIRTLELQGFRYVTHLVWNKVRSGAARGSGYWFTGEHEIVLVGVRGKVDAPATAHFRSNFSAPVGEHSAKPDNLHEIIEFHWPTTPKVEFNARRSRPGWTCWGFDAPENAVDKPEDTAGIEATAEDAPSHGGASSQIANGSDVTRAAEPPALSAGVAPAEHGEVVSDAAAPAARADAAVSPANRPGANSEDDGLDIPAFLRRAPIAQTEMDLARIDRAPAEVVDDRLQTRLPLTEDELELREALLAIDAGTECPWSIMRQAIGAGYAHATTTKIMVTDEGRAFLAQLVGSAPAAIEARA